MVGVVPMVIKVLLVLVIGELRIVTVVSEVNAVCQVLVHKVRQQKAPSGKKCCTQVEILYLSENPMESESPWQWQTKHPRN